MNIYALQYQPLDSKDLKRILDGYEDLVLPAKKALIEHLKEFPNKEDFDQNKIEALKISIDEEAGDIKNLKYLDWLGIGIIEKPDEIVIKRNKMAKSRDRWAIFLGILLSFALFPAIGSLFEMFKDFSGSTLVSVLFFGFLGGYGASLLTKALDRSMSLKKFRLRKNHREIILKSCPETMLEEENFSLDLKLATRQVNGDIYLILANGDEPPIDILKFSKLEPVLKETLEHITDKFNNWR